MLSFRIPGPWVSVWGWPRISPRRHRKLLHVDSQACNPECRRSQSRGCHEDRNLIRVGMQPGPDGLIQRRRQQPQSILQCPYPPTHPPGPSGRQGQSSFSQVDRAHLDESLPGPRATSRMPLLEVGLVPTPHSPSPEACSPSSQILKFLNRTIYCM